jgi:hypothetical protein
VPATHLAGMVARNTGDTAISEPVPWPRGRPGAPGRAPAPASLTPRTDWSCAVLARADALTASFRTTSAARARSEDGGRGLPRDVARGRHDQERSRDSTALVLACCLLHDLALVTGNLCDFQIIEADSHNCPSRIQSSDSRGNIGNAPRSLLHARPFARRTESVDPCSLTTPVCNGRERSHRLDKPGGHWFEPSTAHPSERVRPPLRGDHATRFG